MPCRCSGESRAPAGGFEELSTRGRQREKSHFPLLFAPAKPSLSSSFNSSAKHAIPAHCSGPIRSFHRHPFARLCPRRRRRARGVTQVPLLERPSPGSRHAARESGMSGNEESWVSGQSQVSMGRAVFTRMFMEGFLGEETLEQRPEQRQGRSFVSPVP